VGLKLRLVVPLDILFPSRNMSIVLLCGLFPVHRNGSIVSLDLLGWVYFVYVLYCFGCWRGFVEILDLVVVFGIAEVHCEGIHIDWFIARVLVALWWSRRRVHLKFFVEIYGIHIDWFIARVLVVPWWSRRRAHLRFQSFGL
jgi:hypothetical protein